jgi:DNA-binding NarL/FixJ family response regulator
VNPIRLVVVDDHVLFRRGLIGLLSDMPEFQVAGEAGNGREALQLIEKLHPDIILLDVNMPGMSGVETLRALRGMGNQSRALMLTVSQEEDDLVGAITAGASGYLLKNAEPEALRRTLLDIFEGQSALSPEVTGMIFKVMRRSQMPRSHELLSDRELEVLRLLARGQTTLQISEDLFISENTVKTHIRHILDKMEVGNRAEAVAKALQAGMI